MASTGSFIVNDSVNGGSVGTCDSSDVLEVVHITAILGMKLMNPLRSDEPTTHEITSTPITDASLAKVLCTSILATELNCLSGRETRVFNCF